MYCELSCLLFVALFASSYGNFDDGGSCFAAPKGIKLKTCSLSHISDLFNTLQTSIQLIKQPELNTVCSTQKQLSRNKHRNLVELLSLMESLRLFH